LEATIYWKFWSSKLRKNYVQYECDLGNFGICVEMGVELYKEMLIGKIESYIVFSDVIM